MFETLDQLVPEVMVNRRWRLLIYGTYCLLGLVFAVLSVRRHGFLRPVGFVNACAMLFLSLTFFFGTLRSATPRKRKHVVQMSLLLLTMMVNVIVRL